VVSTALLIDLWYVTQTTGAFTVEDLDQVVAVVSDETTAIDLVPIDTRVFRAWRPLDRRVLSDPWDRLIVATALAEGVPLVTRDEAISASGYVDVVW
jgi:PIN domain nuclease of toxin-antitoxin system